MAVQSTVNSIHTALRPTRGWVAIDLGELLRFKDLLLEFARRDIKLRYKQTVLGIAWVVLQPLLAAGIFELRVRRRRRHANASGTSYFLFTFAGLLAWNVFSMRR